MNRIVLIGNGFDLAHGLSTSYKDFMYWYWGKIYTELSKCNKNTYSDGLCTFTIHDKLNTWDAFLSGKSIDKKAFYEFPGKDNGIIRIYYTPFMVKIGQSIEMKGWVDIENEYYRALNQEYFDSPEKLNKEFFIIRSNLIEYLTDVQLNKIGGIELNRCLRSKIMAPIRENEVAVSARSQFISFIENRLDNINNIGNHSIGDLLGLTSDTEKYLDVRKFLREQQEQIELFGIGTIIGNGFIPSSVLYPNRLMLLNFNYTNTADLYIPQNNNIKYNFLINHIHGKLCNPNSIIFGYGDELDDNYKSIINVNNNEYLQNIKSIKYLETQNYRNMLEFIESAPYQIYIMGHSCGNSDRTLLNTLFEHKNCVSIKPFYYVKEDGSDNYLEIITNISRNFTDMKLMRDRVVNKIYCEPM